MAHFRAAALLNRVRTVEWAAYSFSAVSARVWLRADGTTAVPRRASIRTWKLQCRTAAIGLLLSDKNCASGGGDSAVAFGLGQRNYVCDRAATRVNHLRDKRHTHRTLAIRVKPDFGELITLRTLARLSCRRVGGPDQLVHPFVRTQTVK